MALGVDFSLPDMLPIGLGAHAMLSLLLLLLLLAG